MKTALLSIGFLISSGLAVYFYTSKDTSSNNDESLANKVLELEKENSSLKTERKKSEIKLDQLEDKISSLEKLVEKVGEVKKEKEEIAQKEKSEPIEEIAEEKVEQLSPAEERRREQLKKVLSREIDKNYASLFESMDLNDEMIASIKEKLLDRDTEIVSAIFRSVLQALPTEEGQTQEQALAKSILDSIEKTNSVLELDLGDSFGEFREQEQRGYTMRELGNFEGMLSGNDLGDDQLLGLNDLMFEHHNSVLQDVASGETTFKKADEELVRKSGDYLNADQQKILSNYLKMKRGGN